MVYLVLALATMTAPRGALSDDPEEESNEVAAPPSKVNLDSNLRRALLKALTELENEEASREDSGSSDIVEKASASSVSIISHDDGVTVAPDFPTTTTFQPEKVTVVFQRSQSHEQPTITTLEKDYGDEESIQTSATNNFGNQPFGKDSQSSKTEKPPNQNSIFNEEKTFTKTQKPLQIDESEAKVEDVQFFSAPLVAAFTVHQDEAGLPKKVEPIFRTHIPTKSQEQIIIEKEQQIKLAKQQEHAQLVQQQREKIRLEELKRHQEKLQLQQKHKALEEEIYRLNLSLRQQQQILLKQQEEFRARANPFVPLQSVPFNNQQQNFKPNVAFNQPADAGKLPANGQFLPVKGPVDFRTPFPISNNNFNEQIQSNRVFRQNIGFGNFGFNNNNNNFNRNPNSFSIQPSITPNVNNNFRNQLPIQQPNRFFRSNNNAEASFSSFLQPPNPPVQAQNTRFFRSNADLPGQNYQLSNLLYNSGAFRGKSSEDLNLISKVLSLHHDGGAGLSLRPELRQQQFANRF
ncbi:unnamed protein product [Phyllotreta striolata]|uniref:Uncharacterized protein n=1 Tax=Phyllotreta striolata TaxID=444603 RepID=A0A9N9XN21_PHYSR|nr:unnamed protein product [Phyllotreta striolata]